MESQNESQRVEYSGGKMGSGSPRVLPPPSPNDDFPQGAEGPLGPTGQAGEPVSVRDPWTLCLVQGMEGRTHGASEQARGENVPTSLQGPRGLIGPRGSPGPLGSPVRMPPCPPSRLPLHGPSCCLVSPVRSPFHPHLVSQARAPACASARSHSFSSPRAQLELMVLRVPKEMWYVLYPLTPLLSDTPTP